MLRAQIRSIWRSLFRRSQVEQEMASELQFHLEARAKDLTRRNGLSPQEARRRARIEFGSVEKYWEEGRSAIGLRLLDNLAADLRYALRTWRRAPLFPATAILILALGIGGNVAIFGLIEAVMLRTLSVREPEQLTQVTLRTKSEQLLEHFPVVLVRALERQTESFEGSFGFSVSRFLVGPPDAPQLVTGMWVTGGYHETLGVRPVTGRLLQSDDDRQGSAPVVVISDRYWERAFARSLDAIGQSLLVAGVPVTVVGVSPPDFDGPSVGDVADLTLPLGVFSQLEPQRAFMLDPGGTWLQVLARRRPGVSMLQAESQLAAIWSQLVTDAVPPSSPEARSRALNAVVQLRPGGSGVTSLRSEFRQPLASLMALVGLLLLIACANLASLLLARAAARQRELSVRIALGAGRLRILRQLLTESALLALAGSLGGLLLASVGIRLLVEILSSGRFNPVSLNLTPNGSVIGFAILLAFVVTLLFGLTPALSTIGVERRPVLQGHSGNIVSPQRRMASTLVTSQVALSLVLLTIAGLFVESLRNLRSVDTGLHLDRVLLVNVDGPRAGYRGARLATLHTELVSLSQGIPGVASVSFSAIAPPSGGGGISLRTRVEGHAEQSTHFNFVAPRYFDTLGTPFVAGRDFTASDDLGSTRVAIVNEAYARRYFGEASPIGQHMFLRTTRDTETELEIVGLVRNVVYETLRDGAPPTLYAPYGQRGGRPDAAEGPVTFEVRVDGPLGPMAAALRRQFQPRLAGSLVDVRPLTWQVERTLVRERLLATVALSVAVLALLLTSVGLYGLLAYTVVRRTREIGLRMALGAQREEVRWWVVRDAGGLLAFGVAIGLPIVWAASRFVKSLLFGLDPMDLRTIGVAIGLLLVVGSLAAWLPARRAARVDPMVALRCE